MSKPQLKLVRMVSGVPTEIQPTESERALMEALLRSVQQKQQLYRGYLKASRFFWISVLCNIVLLGTIWFAI